MLYNQCSVNDYFSDQCQRTQTNTDCYLKPLNAQQFVDFYYQAPVSQGYFDSQGLAESAITLLDCYVLQDRNNNQIVELLAERGNVKRLIKLFCKHCDPYALRLFLNELGFPIIFDNDRLVKKYGEHQLIQCTWKLWCRILLQYCDDKRFSDALLAPYIS